MTKIEELSAQTGNTPIIPETTETNEQVPYSPIWIRGNDEKGYYATLGDHRITEIKDKVTIESEIYEKDWNTIISVIVTIIAQVKKIEEENNNNNK